MVEEVQKQETVTEYLSRIGKKGARAAKKKLTYADRKRFGKMGGRGNKKKAKK
jgi:hypothetical protein